MRNLKRIQNNEENMILNTYLDNIYEKMGWDFERVLDKTRQLQGIDVIFYSNCNLDSKILVDEKAATQYLGEDLNTFSFEIYSENNRNKIGWLINPNIKTTHYAIIYPRSKSNDINNLDSLEWILVEKKKIINLINSIPNINKYIKEVYKDSYENKVTGRNQIIIRLYKKTNRNSPLVLKLVWSKNILPEKPLNILIPKYKLIEMSDKYIKLKYK